MKIGNSLKVLAILHYLKHDSPISKWHFTVYPFVYLLHFYIHRDIIQDLLRVSYIFNYHLIIH